MGRTGIIGAMEEEVALLKEKMEIEVVVKKASMEFYQGHLRPDSGGCVQCEPPHQYRNCRLPESGD